MSDICPRVKGYLISDYANTLASELAGRGVTVAPYGMEQTLKFGSKLFLYKQDVVANKFYVENMITHAARTLAKEVAKVGSPVVFKPTKDSIHSDGLYFMFDIFYQPHRMGYELTFSAEFAKRD